jgi:hypothetical protein
MRERKTNLNRLTDVTRIDRRVVDAIAHERYTPSPEDRDLVSKALGFPRDRIVWGHRAAVEDQFHARL